MTAFTAYTEQLLNTTHL